MDGTKDCHCGACALQREECGRHDPEPHLRSHLGRHDPELHLRSHLGRHDSEPHLRSNLGSHTRLHGRSLGHHHRHLHDSHAPSHARPHGRAHDLHHCDHHCCHDHFDLHDNLWHLQSRSCNSHLIGDSNDTRLESFVLLSSVGEGSASVEDVVGMLLAVVEEVASSGAEGIPADALVNPVTPVRDIAAHNLAEDEVRSLEAPGVTVLQVVKPSNATAASGFVFGPSRVPPCRESHGQRPCSTQHLHSSEGPGGCVADEPLSNFSCRTT